MRQNITNDVRTQVLRCGTVEAVSGAGLEPAADLGDMLNEVFREKIGGVLSISTISNALHVLKITRKKRAFTPQNSSGKTCRKSGSNGP